MKDLVAWAEADPDRFVAVSVAVLFCVCLLFNLFEWGNP